MILYDYQYKAVKNLHNGAILCGGVGSGKSRTSLFYYITRECDGDIDTKILHPEADELEMIPGTRFRSMRKKKDLYIITTAKKRDNLEWEGECASFGLPESYGVKVMIDSWNNIKKYVGVYGAFFIFDEQRVVGSGAWVKAFLTIARKNHWILLSATPGDQWSDYIPVFVANGFYKNKTEFCTIHCIYSRFAKFPKIEKYVGTKLLERNRDSILVPMKDTRLTSRHDIYVDVSYDRDLYKTVMRDRWDPYENEPIAETGKLLYILRRVVNSDESRLLALKRIILKKRNVIIFYNYFFELELIENLLDDMGIAYAEWNGRRHDNLKSILNHDIWAYLVQYVAGSEGWNCTNTDTIIFYSQTYSYRVLEQASGRIDRINTKFKDLYYYHLKSSAPIDRAILEKLKKKENFNERAFIRRFER